MAQPPRRVNSESRRRNMESATTNSSAVVNGVASVKPKTSRHSSDSATSPYSQTMASAGKPGEISRRVSQKDKPAIPAKPPPHKVPPPKYGKTVGNNNAVTTGAHSKAQSPNQENAKCESVNRVNGSPGKKSGDKYGEGRPPSGKSRYSLEITLEKKISTPTVRRKQGDREISNSTASSSEESSPLQSPSKSVHLKSSRSNSASSTESRDRLRLAGTPGHLPRYQTHTISSSDKIQGRPRSAIIKSGPSSLETVSDTQLNGSSIGTLDPVKRGRARSVGPIRRVRSNEMMPPKGDLSPSPKSGTMPSQVRSKSVERSRNRQSFGGFVQRQRQAWEERVTTVTRRLTLGHVSEKTEKRKSLDPNHAPKIMQKSTVTQRKHMLFGKGASVQKVKTTIDGSQVSKPTSPTGVHKTSDASQQVPNTKSSSSDTDLRSAKVEANGRVGSKAQGDNNNVSSSDLKRTSIVDNPADKPSVLQEIAPSPSSKPNAPSSLPIKPVYQPSDPSHRVSTAKENKVGSHVTEIDGGVGVDETDNAKMHLFIDEDVLLTKTDPRKAKAQMSDSELKPQEGYSEILGLADPKEINKRNSEALQSLKKAGNTFLEVEKKKEAPVDKVKEIEKAGMSNGEDVGEKDGHYFLRVVNEEQSRIEALCRKVEHDLETEMPDEASGILRAFLGKANLLTSKKFKQFRGLCEQNITNTINPEGGRTTLASDLAGFWDMVMIQVDDINRKFIDIETIKENNWKVVAPPVVTKPTPRKTPAKRAYGRQVSREKDEKTSSGVQQDTAKQSAKESRAAKMRAAREEARKRLIAAKKQAARQRIKSNSSETEVEIFTASGPQQ